MTDTILVKKNKFSIGDKVLVDGQQCEVFKIGEKTDSVHVRVIDPPKTGKRLTRACVFTAGLEKAP